MSRGLFATQQSVTQPESVLFHHQLKMVMKNCISICLIILTVLSACNKESDGNCHPESIRAVWVPGKEVNVNYDTEYQRNNYEIVDGKHILFHYNHTGAQCDDRFDDEWGEILAFAVNKEVDYFEFNNEDILEVNCFYQQFGAWVGHNDYQIKDGIIKGRKISLNRWEIEVSVTTTPLFENEQPRQIEFNALFMKADGY